MLKATLDPEELAWKLANSLIEDFSPFASPAFIEKARSAYGARNLEKVRSLAMEEDGLSIFDFKLQYQLVSLYKKFTFSKDLLSKEQVTRDSVDKFTENQVRLCSLDLGHIDRLTRDVVSYANGWIGQVLGVFDDLELMEEASFGKKSSVGIPYARACESARYEMLTGSSPHLMWFEHRYGVYNRPAHLYAQRRAKNRKVPMYTEVEELTATLVPKTWKSRRMIMPNTTIGTLYSGGLGRVIESRLRSSGYDIANLQKIHGELARQGSIDNSLVTADQSLASDNITVRLIEMLLPQRWADACKFGRIDKLNLEGKSFITPTFSTMGIGFTFPLQTLVFLGLLHGIRLSLGLTKCRISVFGDDLIYSREMHATVVAVFPRLGLVINEDKTFYEGDFRESCGSDYYRGVDVRPFFLGQPDGPQLSGKRAEAYLYKTLNGILRRHSIYTVSTTLELLLTELRKFRKTPLGVPPDFPDTSGVRCYSRSDASELGCQAGWIGRDGLLYFRFVSFEPKLRAEFRHWPIYYRVLFNIRRRTAAPTDVSPDPIRWIKDEAVRSGVIPMITDGDRGRYAVARGTSFRWPH
jgi:hypothetical protein